MLLFVIYYNHKKIYMFLFSQSFITKYKLIVLHTPYVDHGTNDICCSNYEEQWNKKLKWHHTLSSTLSLLLI